MIVHSDRSTEGFVQGTRGARNRVAGNRHQRRGAHALHDGVYDWQESNGLFADRINRTAEVYHTSERVLRELYFSYRRPGIDFKIGKPKLLLLLLGASPQQNANAGKQL